MIALQHPTSLNVLKKYSQACAVLQNTSRASQVAWYKDGLDLDFQFHIIVDGAGVHTFFFNRSNHSWSIGASVTEEEIADPEKTLALGRNLIKQVQDLKGRHLGIVLHVADEFVTTEIKSKLNNPGALNDMRQMIYENPREVIEDSSASSDQTSWRVMPYPASGSPMIATTIRLSRRLEPFLKVLRNLGNDENFPIVTHAVSAPLVAMMSLASVVNTSSNKPFVAVLQYPWFTAMAFFNEHADLRLIRSIQHRGQRCPANFWSSLATTNASLEFEDPDIYLLPLGDQVDTKISDDLKRNFPNSQIETAYFSEVSPLPAWAPEPVLSVADTASQNGETQSHTFNTLRAERWFLQDFLPISAHDQALFPSQNEIRLLRYFKIAKKAMLVALLLMILSMIFSVYGYMRKPEWSVNDTESNIIKQKMMMLNSEKARMDHWNVLLDDRSKAWSSMEMMALLFPEKSNLLVNSFNLAIRTEAVPKQTKVGFFKEWKITGFARNESIDSLNSINTREGITAKFANFLKITGDSSFDPKPASRNLVTNLTIKENPKFVPRPVEDVQDFDSSTYSFTFELTIVQRFDATDTLAIPIAKAP